MTSRRTSFVVQPPVKNLNDIEHRAPSHIPIPRSTRKKPLRRKTQKGPANDGECNFDGTDYPSWLGFDPQKPGSAFRYQFPAVDGDPWEGTMRMMNKYDGDVCDSWNDEIQNLLIFSGLFSAVVTAFAVETQKLLQPEPENVTVLLLAQLNSHFGSNTTFTDDLVESFLDDTEPNNQTFRINCLMFSSLIISLGTALVGIIVLQWVRSFRKVEGGYDRDGISMREARLKAFQTWRVPSIIAYLPVSLGVSFIVFLVGLIDFMESLDSIVAAIIGALVGIIVFFILLTTIAPALHITFSPHPFPLCAYQSAQSLLFCRLFTRFKRVNEWAQLLSELYKTSAAEVRDGWLKEALVGVFHRFNTAHAFRLGYLCFQSIPNDVSRNIDLRWNIVSNVIDNTPDLYTTGKAMMKSIESKATLSPIASSEFFSLLLLLWNNRLGSDYALHRAELNFRCIQTLSDTKAEYQKMIDLWWRRSATEVSLVDEAKQWRPYLATFLTTLRSRPTIEDVRRPLAFSLFWKLIATRIRARSKPPTGTVSESHIDASRVEESDEHAPHLPVVEDCLRVVTSWLLDIQDLPQPKYDIMERNGVIQSCLQPMFDYNVFTVDIANTCITEPDSPFLKFLDIFMDPKHKRLKSGWDEAIEHAWAEKWDDFLTEAGLHHRYRALAKNKRTIHTEPLAINDVRSLSPIDDDEPTSSTISPESQPCSESSLSRHRDVDHNQLSAVVIASSPDTTRQLFASPVTSETSSFIMTPVPNHPSPVVSTLTERGPFSDSHETTDDTR